MIKTHSGLDYEAETKRLDFNWFVFSTIAGRLNAKLSEKSIQQMMRRKSRCPDINIEFETDRVVISALDYFSDKEIIEKINFVDYTADVDGSNALIKDFKDASCRVVAFWRASYREFKESLETDTLVETSLT